VRLGSGFSPTPVLGFRPHQPNDGVRLKPDPLRLGAPSLSQVRDHDRLSFRAVSACGGDRLRLVLLLVAFTISASGCGGNGTEAAACPYCFADDFSDTGNGWPIVNDDVREYRIADGEYVVTLKQTGVIAPKVMGPDQLDADGNRLEIADSKVSVSGRVTAGTPVMGLVCRWVSEPDTQTYAFGVIGNRFAVRGPDGVTLVRGELPEGTDPSQPTRLEASCKGDELTFSIDGTTVATVQDSRLASGSNGVLLATNPDAVVPATATYDDFEIAEAGE
jgi:hypothetical protein